MPEARVVEPAVDVAASTDGRVEIWKKRGVEHLPGWVLDLADRLKAVHFVVTITVFGAAFLLSTLPFVILLSSLANRRVEDDLAGHLGLNASAAHALEQLFRNAPNQSASALILALVLGLIGTVGVAASVQTIYDDVFDSPRRRHLNVLRLLVWSVVLVGWLALDGTIAAVLHHNPGRPVLDAVMVLLTATLFFWWSMRFLLAGQRSWRTLALPALVTGLMWLGLQGFASIYFSSVITNDSKLYGPIGVVFSLLTWFIAIAAVIVLGAVVGEVWQARRHPSPVVPVEPAA